MKHFPKQLTLFQWNKLAGAFHKAKAVGHFLEDRTCADDQEKQELKHWLDVIDDTIDELQYVRQLVKERTKRPKTLTTILE